MTRDTGEAAAILGPSGSGKSTLHCIAALVALFLARAEVTSRLTPDALLPLGVWVLFFVMLRRLGAAALDRARCLRG